MSDNEFLIMFIRPLNLVSSYVSTVFIDYSYYTGYFFSALLISNGIGTSFRIESAIILVFASTSPSEPPPPDY